MEIQGLSDAQNIHSQHGAPHRTTSSPLRSSTASRPRYPCTENEADGQLELPGSQRDNNNNRPRTSSPFRLLGENGSGAANVSLSVSKSQPTDKSNFQSDRLGNVSAERKNELNGLLCAHESVRAAWKYGMDTVDTVMQMELPLFEGEEEPMPQRQLTLPFPVLRQQREDGAFKQPSVACRSAAPPDNIGTVSGADRATQELFVVFNVVQDDGSGEESKLRGTALSEDGNKIESKRQDCAKAAAPCGSMEVGSSSNVNVLLCESSDSTVNCLDTQALKKTEHVLNLLKGNSVTGSAKQGVCHQTVEDVVLTNKYGDKICGQICTENDDGKLARELSPQPHIGESSALISGSSGIVEAMDTSDFISNSSGLQDSANPATASTSPHASETFSGTITINNQSIIVTIENGILTLAAPPEGHVHKDDDMVSLKEHLGMKDHEDIVLLNYDSGTKSIGKISTLAVPSVSQQKEPRPGLSVSDSELALVDDCSLSELGTSLDSCSIVKQEAGVLCAVKEADLAIPSPKAAVADCDSEDFQAVPQIRSKKETVTSFGCPEPGCSSTFDTRQKLKVHLLNHAEDPRPYQCTVEGCGWAFATSYKLKRHLQSHDKQRPHTCQFEGCGRRFTTVYNLKAHVKVHEHDNSFICEICSERFRSAARLANHQRVHFEPQRPHKCEFPGKKRKLFPSQSCLSAPSIQCFPMLISTR